ncbi:MAG: nitroreductase family protein [Phycisphaeraceae bacterium]|nr:nitroreductase family protein [Phycisphaeraceae bacterium]
MDFDAVIHTRRSIRSFSSRPIPAEVLDRILRAARMAPSANNQQPWRFIVVRDVVQRAALAELCLSQNFVAEAPVVVVCCGRRSHNPYSWLAEHLHVVDVTIAVDHLILAARNEGVGSCWVGAFEHDGVRQLLRVPESHDVIMVVPLGYPDEDGAFHVSDDRAAMKDIVAEETFDGRH